MKPSPAVFFPVPEFCWNSAIAQGAFEVDGRMCYARQLFDNVLFRFDDPADVSRTLFLTRKLAEDEKVGLYEDDAFASQVRAGEIGRFVIYRSPSAKNCCLALFFRPDGTGFFQDKRGHGDAKEDDEVPFTWNAQDAGLVSEFDILIGPKKRLLPLCERVYVEQIWPAMRDPHVAATAFPDETFHFVRGSRAKLVRLTGAACRILENVCSEEANSAGPHIVSYTGVPGRDIEEAITRLLASPLKSEKYTYVVRRLMSNSLRHGRLQRLQSLIMAHNLFTGGKWNYISQGNGKRITRYRFVGQVINLPTPSLPSAHERIEAFLELSQWLEGKVTPEEKAELLYMDAQASVPI